MFERYIGVDYSGAATATSRLPGLEVYTAAGGEPQRCHSRSAMEGARRKWTRKEIAQWLLELVDDETRFIAGIDHGFSFPVAYFERYGLQDWDRFLEDFCAHWPTDEDNVYVDFIREENPARTGDPAELRLAETWTASAQSVFRFEGKGQVGKSTHAGIPWLARIRRQVGERVHFWPFDGWALPRDKPVIAEVYPSFFRRRSPRARRNAHQQDAYAVARWLAEAEQRGILDHYAHPPLTESELAQATLEGWILGVT
jgi:hypothetical protein